MLIDSLLTSSYFTSPLVFTIYCLSVSYKLRNTGSVTRDEALLRPLSALVTILTVNLGTIITIQSSTIKITLQVVDSSLLWSKVRDWDRC
jgi:hypothetical protein